MTLKRPKGPGKETADTLVVLEHGSKILEGTSLGDPRVRKLGVWLPPQYEADRGGIRHRCEEFDDDHSGIDRRMNAGLPFLHRALRWRSGHDPDGVMV